VKPGNRVEDKTLTIRKQNLDVPVSSLGYGKPWTRSDGDSDEESKQSCREKNGTRNPKGDTQIPKGMPTRLRVSKAMRGPVPVIGPLATR